MSLYDQIVDQFPEVVAGAFLNFDSVIEKEYSNVNDFLYTADKTLKINLIDDRIAYIGYVHAKRVFFAKNYPVVHFNLTKENFKCGKIMLKKNKPMIDETFTSYGYKYLIHEYVNSEFGRYVELQYYQWNSHGNYFKFLVDVFEILSSLYCELF